MKLPFREYTILCALLRGATDITKGTLAEIGLRVIRNNPIEVEISDLSAMKDKKEYMVKWLTDQLIIDEETLHEAAAPYFMDPFYIVDWQNEIKYLESMNITME